MSKKCAMLGCRDITMEGQRYCLEHYILRKEITMVMEEEKSSVEKEKSGTTSATNTLNLLSTICYRLSLAAGWWMDNLTGETYNVHTTPFCFGAKISLIHSELSEALEGHRKGLMDDKLPHRKMAEVELADALIRIFDLAGACGMDLGGAVREKLEYNKHREDHKVENRMKEGGKKY